MSYEASDKDMKAMEDILKMFIERDINPNSSAIILTHLFLCFMKAYSNKAGWYSSLKVMRKDWDRVEPSFTQIKTKEEFEKL